MTPLTKIAELRALSDAANTDKMTCTHEPCSEESRLWLGVHERAMLDGRLIGKERADAELIAALWNNRTALLAVAEAAANMREALRVVYGFEECRFCGPIHLDRNVDCSECDGFGRSPFMKENPEASYEAAEKAVQIFDTALAQLGVKP